MEQSFFRIMRRLEKKGTVSKWRIEQFFYYWGTDFPVYLQFILSHYHEINTLLHLALENINPLYPANQNRTGFLLRHEQLSLCLNHFEHVVTPLFLQKDDRAVKTIRACNQSVLTRWETRTCLPETAVASSVVAIKSPGRIDTFLKL